jgi:hypothetical protein
MPKYYCTFWYPTIFLAEAKKREDKKQIKRRLDDDGQHTFEVILNIDDDENITIKTIITEKKENDIRVEFELFLKKLAKRSNGFIQYEFDFNLSEDVCGNLKKLTMFENCKEPINKFREHFERVLSNPIYHYITEFYHKHDTIVKDSYLTAICFEEERDYVPLDNANNCNNNKYLLHFLDCFTVNFKQKALFVSDLNFLLKEVVSKFTGKYATGKFGILLTEDFPNISDDETELLTNYSQELDRICEDTLIEYVYCKTLLCSIYNKFSEIKLELRDNEILKIECKIEKLRQSQQDVESLEKDKKQKIDELEKLKELRRKALDIENAVRYIEIIKFENQKRQNIISRILLAKNSLIHEQTTSINEVLKKSGKLNNISFVIAIFGILLTVVSAFQDQLKGTTLCNFNSYSSILIVVVFFFIIALVYFSFRSRK